MHSATTRHTNVGPVPTRQSDILRDRPHTANHNHDLWPTELKLASPLKEKFITILVSLHRFVFEYNPAPRPVMRPT